MVVLKSVLEACMVHVVYCDIGERDQTNSSLADHTVASVMSLYKHYEVLPTLLEACATDKKTSKSKKEAIESDSADSLETLRKTCFPFDVMISLLRKFTEDRPNTEDRMEDGMELQQEANLYSSLRRFFLHIAIEELDYLQSDSCRQEQLQFNRSNHLPRYHPHMVAWAQKVRCLVMALGPLFFKAYKATRENPCEEVTSNVDTTQNNKSKKTESSSSSSSTKSSETTTDLALSGFQTSLRLILAAAKVISSDSFQVNNGDNDEEDNDDQERGETLQFIVSDFVWDCFAASPKENAAGQDHVAIIGKGVKSLVKHVASFCEATTHVSVNQRLASGAINCILTLTAAFPPTQTGVIAKKVGDLCKMQRAPTVKLCEELTRGFVASHGGASSSSLNHLNELSLAVLEQLGASYGDLPTQEPSGNFKLVEDSEGGKARRSMASVVAEVVTEALDHSVKDVEYLLLILKRLPKPSDRRKALRNQGTAAASDEVDDEPGEIMTTCDRICDRIVEFLKALLPVLKCRLDPGKYLERIFSVVRRLYDAIGKLVKFFVDHKVLWLSKAAKLMLGYSAEQFTPVVYHFIQHTMDSGQADKLQLISQGKLVPSIVERIEFVDLQLVTLGRICVKTDDVHSFIVRSSARDFKINMEALQNAYQLADENSKRKKDQKASKSKKKTKKSKKKAKDEDEGEDEDPHEDDTENEQEPEE